MFYFCIPIGKISDSFSFNHNIIYFADSVALLSSIYYMPKRRSSTVSTPEPIASSESSSEDEIVTPDPKRSKRNERHKMTVKSLSGHFNLARCPPNCPHEHADVLIDPLNQKVHFVCTTEGCTFQSHCRFKNVSLRSELRCSSCSNIAKVTKRPRECEKHFFITRLVYKKIIISAFGTMFSGSVPDGSFSSLVLVVFSPSR